MRNMTYFLFWLVIYIVLNLFFRKREIYKQRKFRIVLVAAVLLLGTLSALIPSKYSMFTCHSPEEAFLCDNSGDIVLVLEGSESAYIVAKNEPDVYSFDYVIKKENGWSPVRGVIPSSTTIQDGSVFVRVYRYGDSDDYYVAISDNSGKPIVVSDNRGSTFYQIGDMYETTNQVLHMYTYYTYVNHLNSPYQVTVNEKLITIK